MKLTTLQDSIQLLRATFLFMCAATLLLVPGPLRGQGLADDRTVALVSYIGLEAPLNPASHSLQGLVLGLEYAWRRNRVVLTPLDFAVMIPGDGAYVLVAAGAGYLYRDRAYAGFQIGAARFDPARPTFSGRITSGEIVGLVQLEVRVTYQRIEEHTSSTLLLVRFPAWF